MDLIIKSDPEALISLARRMERASEDLQHDAAEIQYLLSQFGDAISGEEITRTIDGAKSEVEHCKRLSDILNGISADLRKIYAAYLRTEEITATRIMQSLP